MSDQQRAAAYRALRFHVSQLLYEFAEGRRGELATAELIASASYLHWRGEARRTQMRLPEERRT